MIRQQNALRYNLLHTGNADQNLLSFDLLYEQSIDFKGLLTVDIKTSGNKKIWFILILAVTGDGKKAAVIFCF